MYVLKLFLQLFPHEIALNINASSFRNAWITCNPVSTVTAPLLALRQITHLIYYAEHNT